jgi:GTPase SAR1 family protein
MAPSRWSERVLLLAAIAAVGVLLVWVPPQLVEQYEKVRSWGQWQAYLYLAIVGTGGLILLGLALGVFWKLWSATRTKAAQKERQAKNPSQLSAAEQRREVEDNLAAVGDLETDAAISDDVKRELKSLAAKVEEKQQSHKLEIVAFGTVSSGKSSLLNALAGRDAFQTDPRGGTTMQRQEIPWPGNDQVLLVDTPGLGEIDGAEHIAVAAEAARDADLVLMVVDGPLRQSEFKLLSRLGEMEKRVLLCLNKADWYEPADQKKLVGQLASLVREYIPAEDVIAVRAQPVMRTRVRVLPDGGEAEEQVREPPDLGALADKMLSIVRRDGTDLLLANLLLQSRGLVEEAKQKVRESLDRRAWEIVDRYTWGAGAAAAVSPFPVLDLFAGSAITAKMVVDLAQVYRQPLDFNAAVALLGQLGKNLVAILGVNLAAPAVTSVIASVLKGTVPLAGQFAGGLLQGIVQALVTRWIGAVFVGYFKAEMQMPAEGLANLARREWQRLTSPAELVKLVQQARQVFGSGKRGKEE